MANEKAYNEKEVANLIGLSPKTLQRWRLFNQGPPFKKMGRAVRYSAADLNAWVASRPSGGEVRVS